MMQWNNSALACLERCGEQFRRRYINHERVPPAPKQIRGTIVHRVASGALLRKLSGQTLPTVEEAKDVAATEFTRAWDGGVKVPVEDIDEAGSLRAVADRTKDFAVDLAGFHVETVAPIITPVGVERKITVKPKDSDLVIHGTIDLIAATPTGEEIRDLKTSEKSPPPGIAHKSQQLTMYAMIRMAEVGALPETLTLDYLVRTPVRAEKKHLPLMSSRDGEDVQTMVHRINTAVEAVQRGVFMPTHPENWWCARQWCEYWESCVYVRRGPR